MAVRWIPTMGNKLFSLIDQKKLRFFYIFSDFSFAKIT